MARILILDDVADSGLMVKRILGKKGHEVHVFSDEDDVLRFVGGQPVDLAILDMKLRKMDGNAVLAELKILDPRLPVIILTGFPTKAGSDQAFRLGAFAFRAKPIDKQDLEETVAAALAYVSKSTESG